MTNPRGCLSPSLDACLQGSISALGPVLPIRSHKATLNRCRITAGSRQQDTATQLSGGTAWGPEDHPMPCTPHFSQLAFVGLCHGGHWSWIQINASSAVMSFDLLLHLQRPFIIKLGETRTFLRQVLLCYEAALQNSAMGLQFVAMQVRAGHGLLAWVSKVASEHFPFGSPQSPASSPQLSYA